LKPAPQATAPALRPPGAGAVSRLRIVLRAMKASYGSWLMNVTFISHAWGTVSGGASHLHDDVLPQRLGREAVVPDVSQSLGFLEPAGVDDLAPGAGEDGG